VGTYNNQTGLTAAIECKACVGGYYCDSLGAVTTTGKCSQGYYCKYGVDRAMPSGDNATLINGTCQLPGL